MRGKAVKRDRTATMGTTGNHPTAAATLARTATPPARAGQESVFIQFSRFAVSVAPGTIGASLQW